MKVCFGLINEKKWIDKEIIKRASTEANELTSIFVTILKNTKSRIKYYSKVIQISKF